MPSPIPVLNLSDVIAAATHPKVCRIIFKSNEIRYCIIGTAYGYLHTSAGDLRTWKSYSGAYKVMKAYRPF